VGILHAPPAYIRRLFASIPAQTSVTLTLFPRVLKNEDMSLTDAPPPPDRPSRSILESVLPYTTVAVVLAALYVAWIFYSRYESNQKAQQEIQTKKQEAVKREADLIYGSGEIKFTTFGAATGVLKRGETTQLCYGVVNATTVKLDPPVEQAKPVFRRCVDISPQHTTTYTITASDAKGNSQSESITVQVK